MEPPSAPKKKMGMPLRILILVCGLLVIVGGVIQIKRGVTQIIAATGSATPTTKPLLLDIDKEVDTANKSSLEVSPMFQKLLNDVDSLGLDKVRQQEKATGEKVMGLLGKSADAFRAAAKLSEKAAGEETRSKVKQFLTTKVQVYTQYADVRSINQEITRLVFDESILKVDDLLVKLDDPVKRRDAAQKIGDEAEAAANILAKDIAAEKAAAEKK
jgi:hypothetical protein